MICKDFNIINCPQCHNGRTDLCWMIEYRKLFVGMRERDVKDLYVECLGLTAFYLKDIRCSYWIEAIIKAYYPQYQETIDKIRILL